MSVDGVNNNNNTAAITAGSAIVGAAGGGLTAYNMKPWLKDGMPTDSFAKEIKENIIKTAPKHTLEQIKQNDENFKKLMDSKTIQEFDGILKTKFADSLDDMGSTLDTSSIENLKSDFKKAIQFNNCGLDTMDDWVRYVFRSIYEKTSKRIVFNGDKMRFEEYAGLDKAAKNIQFKSAALWGAVGAAVLGVGGYLVSSMSSKKAQPQSAPAEQAPASTEKSEPPKTEKA